MKRMVCIAAAILLSLSAWAEDFSGFMDTAFGSDINSLTAKLEKDGWKKDGTDYATFDGDFFTYYYAKDYYVKEDSPTPSTQADSIALTASYNQNKFYMATEVYQFTQPETLAALSESEKNTVSRYNLRRCSEQELLPLKTFFSFDEEQILSDTSEIGDLSASCARFYISDSGNYYAVIVEQIDADPEMNMVMIISGLGSDCQKEYGSKVSAPKLKAKKNSSEVFAGIPFGTKAIDSILTLKADGWAIVASQSGANDFYYVYAIKEGGKFNGIDVDALMLVFHDDALLLGGAMFEATEDFAAKKEQLANLEKSFTKSFKLKNATKEEVEKYSDAMGAPMWEDEANQSEVGNMDYGLRIVKSKEGSIFQFRADETGVVILQLAKSKVWHF